LVRRDEERHFLLPMHAQLCSLVMLANAVQLFDELRNDHLVIEASLVGGPVGDSQGNGKRADRRAVCTFQVGSPVQLHFEARIIAGDAVHAEVLVRCRSPQTKCSM
jgi:hypothetical protein